MCPVPWAEMRSYLYTSTDRGGYVSSSLPAYRFPLIHGLPAADLRTLGIHPCDSSKCDERIPTLSN